MTDIEQTDIDIFEADWSAASAALGRWRHSCVPEHSDSYLQAVIEAAEHPNGQLLLPKGQDVPVPFRRNLLIRYLGVNSGYQGCTFHGFLLTVPGRLEVLTWIEDDKPHYRLRWRGERQVFEEVAAQLKRFSGAWLPEVVEAA